MRCSLINICDVALMVGFKGSQDAENCHFFRNVILHPGDKCFYEDSIEIVTDDTWDFVEWGFIRDEDEPNLVSSHAWAIEGF